MSDVTGGGKKVLIITGTTDIGRPEDSNDSSHEELFELTLPSKQKYAKKKRIRSINNEIFRGQLPIRVDEKRYSLAV